MQTRTQKAKSHTPTKARGTRTVPSAPTPRSRGSIQARGAGKWLVRVYVGTDAASGRRKYSSETVAGTRKEAERAATRMLSELDKGTFVEPAKQTLRAYALSWLDGEGAHTLSACTRDGYTQTLTRYVFPVLGSRRLDKITPHDLQQLYTRMVNDGLSPNTVRLTHAPLRRILNRAVELDVLARNPCDRVKTPKVERKERTTLTPTQVDRFLVATEGTPLRPLWALLLGSGLRPQEALALRWDDLEGDTLRVRRALSKISAGRYEVRETKTSKSRRALRLPSSVVSTLTAHRKEQNKAALKQGAGYARSGYIFTTRTGTLLDPYRVSRKWGAELKRAGLPVVRLYDSRHTHATQLFEAGVPAKVVQERLGHASIVLTLDTYTHMLAGMDAQAVDAFDALYAKARKAS